MYRAECFLSKNILKSLNKLSYIKAAMYNCSGRFIDTILYTNRLIEELPYFPANNPQVRKVILTSDFF